MTISPDVLCGLGAMICFGLANLCSQPAARAVGPMRALLWRNLTMVCVISAALPFLADASRLTGRAVVHAIATALVGYLPIYFFYRGIEVGKLGVVAPIANAYVLVTVLIGVLVLHEPFTLGATLAVLCTVVGLVVMTINPRDWRSSELFTLRSGAPYALVTMVGWGIFFPLAQSPGQQLGGVTNSFVVESTFALIALVHIQLRRQTMARPRGPAWWRVLGSGIFSAIASISVLTGLELGRVTVVAPFAAASPLVAISGAALFFGERLRSSQYLGAAITIVGIVWLALSNGGPA